MRYVIGVLVAIGLVIVILILIFSGGGSSKLGSNQVDLDSLADTNSKVRLVIQGELVADQNRRSLSITVGRDSSVLRIFKGYQNKLIKSKSYNNNRAAYATFLRGLTLAEFNKGNDDPAASDERGHCAFGQRYLYEVVDPSGGLTQRYWDDSCGVGSFEGLSDHIQDLFIAQIPDYDDLTSGVDL